MKTRGPKALSSSKVSSPEDDVIRRSEEHQKLKD